ncbi:hypothetical protein IW140_001208 [Coemansia sp. RSA 1813]|nr:hypothetical protein EV178_001202 [Coemansia sp. RSA 1646]KAJ1772142.1 hypothetical protein LPJ74_001727 [Coemansia sp. RSA 1843]KAJ2091739.1 hypothetical protein IW138_001722 [Coemansia sp. RSA 986]KAJ2216857.1 hypothetical protein EV179_000891 [Coemansia sp. RSA 487]KAJ2571859.1 hypothetical protein IW140_001208 [Coemansia sp. RSA 1813]
MTESGCKKIALDASKIRDFGFQVAGHPGVLEVEDNGMIIKPLDQRELEFYEGSKTSCPELRPFMPLFFGTLEHAPTEVSSLPELTEKKKYICLENLVHEFKEPCVLDIKIGSRLWDIDATPEKRERTIRQASRTTSAELGISVTGMRLHGQPAVDRDWCRNLTPTTVMGALDMYFSAAEQRVSPEYRRQVVEQFIEEVTELKAVIEKAETRMYSSSLLFVYEASKERYELLAAQADASNDNDGSSDGDGDDGALINMKIIDFAHSHWTPGQGRDDNYLVGISKLIEILGTVLQKWQ